MPWTPDPDFKEAAERILGRAQEEAILDRAARVRDERARLAARGLAGGAAARSEEQSAVVAFRTFGERATQELVAFFESIYGRLPAGSTDWFRATLNERFDRFAEGMAQQLAERRVKDRLPTRGSREGVDRVRAAVRMEVIVQVGFTLRDGPQ